MALASISHNNGLDELLSELTLYFFPNSSQHGLVRNKNRKKNCTIYFTITEGA